MSASSPPCAAAPPRLRLRSELWKLLRPYPGTLCLAGIALLLATAATLTIPITLRNVIDAGWVASQDPLTAARLNQDFLALLSVALLLAGSSALRYYLVSWLGERIVVDLRRHLFEHLLNLDAGFFSRNPPGELLSRVHTDTTLVQGVIGSSLSVALRSLITLVGGVAMLCFTSPHLAAYILLLVPLVITPVIIAGRRVRQLSRATQDRIADSSRLADELLGAVPLVQAFTREKEENQRYAQAMERSFAMARRRVSARAWLTMCAISLVFGAVILVLWLGARDVLAGHMSPGELGQFVLYAILVAGSAASLSEIWGELQRAAGATERILELRQTRSRLRVSTSPTTLKQPVRGEISFQNVYFSYPEATGAAPALRDLSFSVAAGETVVLVGPSGAGKSTVFRLLLRQYDPDQGELRLDGVHLERLAPQALRRCLAYAPQEATLFSMAMKENIAFGHSGATTEEVRQAARAAQADKFISLLSQGYQGSPGEGGARLSGGQRQRVTLARAFLRNAPLLLLDEPTSALDEENAHLVLDSITKLAKGRTTLIIAHRLATVRHANRILVMDQGHLLDQGHHEELMKRCPLYTRLTLQDFNNPSPTTQQPGEHPQPQQSTKTPK